jgi:hypothetical protein
VTGPASSARVLACGVTESGKSYLLRRLFVNRWPRALVLDPLGEYSGKDDMQLGAKFYEASTLPELRRALAAAVRQGHRWRVVARIAPGELEPVGRLLVPETFDRAQCFAAYVGGLAVVCEEMDVLAPTNAPPWVEAMLRRGRHVGVSFFGASQRPHGISPIVRAMAGYLICCTTHEPRDMRYLEEVLPAPAFLELERLPWQWSLLVDTRARRWWLLDRALVVQRFGDGRAR